MFRQSHNTSRWALWDLSAELCSVTALPVCPSMCKRLACHIAVTEQRSVQALWPLQFVVPAVLRCCHLLCFNLLCYELWTLKTDTCYQVSTSSRKRLVLVAVKAAATCNRHVLFWLRCQLKSSVLHAVEPVVLHNVVPSTCIFVN